MRTSEIKITIGLDEGNIPEQITWQATDTGNKPEDTKAFLLGVWDEKERTMMNINLWNKFIFILHYQNFRLKIIFIH
jgi:gliding motility-associated protein GldC